MRVKYIYCDDVVLFGENFEQEINDFVKDKAIQDIKFQQFGGYDEYDERCTKAGVLIIY